MNFESSIQRQLFFKTLREFSYVFLFTLILLGLAYVVFGIPTRKTETFRCGAEYKRMYQGLQSYYNKGTYFSGGSAQSDKFAFSGTHSIKLTKENPFGFGFNLPYLKGNENITISVWRFSDGKDSRKGIVVASSDGMWKAVEDVVEKSEHGWEKVQLNFIPPAASKNRTLKIYCWNNGHEPIYFDELEIEIKREEKL